MQKKILLFDGLSIANRAFYGMPLLTNKDGEYTNAIYGFINMMLSIIDKEKPDLLGVAFDVNKKTFRHKMTPTYKGTRKGMPEELKSQIPVLKEVLKTMGIMQVELEGYEADDVLGTLAKEGEESGYDVVIVSGDRDLLQVATDKVQLKIPKTKKGGTEIESYYSKDVLEKYEVTPTQFIDVKGLMGDASDNIKGVPGVGEKTATKLIKQYESIEKLYDHIDELKKSKMKENLIANKEEAFESKTLVTILKDVPLHYEWQEFEYTLKLSEEATQYFKRLEFKNLLSKLPKDEVKQEKIVIQQIQPSEIGGHIDSLNEVAISNFIEQGKVGIAVSGGKELLYTMLDTKINHEQIKYIFEEYKGIKIIHDSKALRHQLDQVGIQIKGEVFDTFIAAYLLAPTNKDYDLAQLNELFLDQEDLKSEEQILGKGKDKKTWLQLEEDSAMEIIGKRAEVGYNLYRTLKEKLEEVDMHQLFYDIEMPLVEVLYDMEKEGMSLEQDTLKAYGKELDQLIIQKEQAIYKEVGEEFNINSPKQLGVILFEKMNIPPIKKTKTGYSTSAEVLEKLQADYPIVADILEYRQYTKLKSTYVDGLFSVLAEDGKIHSTFNQTITATGRISSTEPNLQNIPIRLELGRKIRKAFVPKSKDYVFLDADYSQIELRVLAALAEDELMIKAFKEGIDIHTLTASQVFNIPFEEVSPEERYQAKAVNFGIVYGIGAFSLSEDIKVSMKEAQDYIDNYFEKYPKVKAYLDEQVRFAKENGYVTTMFNRRREIPELKIKNFNMREFGKRVAMNTPIQGSAADIIKIAMIKVHHSLRDKKLQSRVLLTVHDELLLEVAKTELEQVKEILRHEMENAVDLSVPLKVDMHSGESWFETK